MKKASIASLALVSAVTAFGQGQLKVDNLIGAGVVTIRKGDGSLLGAGSAQVYRFDAAAAGGVGAEVGGVAPITSTGASSWRMLCRLMVRSPARRSDSSSALGMVLTMPCQ